MRGSRTQNKNCKYKEVSKVTVSQNYPCWLLCEPCCTVFSNFSASVCFLTAVTTFSPPKNKRQKKYRSIISDVFDGTIVSSVQCLTCDRVSAFGCLFVVRSNWNVNENAEMLSRNRGVGRKNAILMMGGKMICDHSDIFALRIILQSDSSWQILIKKKKKHKQMKKQKRTTTPLHFYLLWPSGVCDPGELPGYLVAHSREGRPGQAPLIHPPNLPGKSWLLRGSLCTTGVDSICHGVHQEVCL